MKSKLIIIPTYIRNESDFKITMRCIKSIRATVSDKVYLTIVDDYSPDRKYVAHLNSRDNITRFRYSIHTKTENEGFANTVNYGLRLARVINCDAVLVNADMEFCEPGWLEVLDSVDAAVVGGLLLYPTGLIQHAGIFFSIIRRRYEHIYRFAPGDLPAAQVQRVCPVTGALQLIRHETLENVGVYDEKFRMGWEDVDYCLRVFYSGRKCVYTPLPKIIHYESMFRGNKDAKIENWTRQSFDYLIKKHAGKDISFVPTMI